MAVQKQLIDSYLLNVIEQSIVFMRKDKKCLSKCVITSGYRSIAHQNQLFALGRTAQGVVVDITKVVTNLRGGQSKHNKNPSEAIDVWVENEQYFLLWQCVQLFDVERRIEWGGNYLQKDKVHFELK